ncbi:hypothetical protein N7528_007705 [Penicillium herquei]|nr:hypothetical protein N7528_007705 [Penicillium herquei]
MRPSTAVTKGWGASSGVVSVIVDVWSTSAEAVEDRLEYDVSGRGYKATRPQSSAVHSPETEVGTDDLEPNVGRIDGSGWV